MELYLIFKWIHIVVTFWETSHYKHAVDSTVASICMYSINIYIYIIEFIKEFIMI